MTITSAGLNLVKRFEGLELKAYKDTAGVWTIGYGSTFYQNGTRVSQGDTISTIGAVNLFMYTINKFAVQVSNLIVSNINQNQFEALVSFAYNVGIGAFSKSTLLKKVNANPQDPTIRDEFNKWNKAGGKIVTGLVTRRAAESNYYFGSEKKNTQSKTAGLLAIILIIAVLFLTYKINI